MATAYSEYVAHPRYGQGPRYSGVDVDLAAPETILNATTGCYNLAIRATIERMGVGSGFATLDPAGIVPGTAVVADPARQNRDDRRVGVTHYFDLERTCRRCRRPFLFFAEQQRHWYEELGFTLHSDCVECYECRRADWDLKRRQRRYEELLARPHRTAAETVEAAECCLCLIEAGRFTPRQARRVRYFVNQLLPETGDQAEVQSLYDRVRLIEVRSAAS